MPEESEERSTEDVEAARGQSTPTEATEDADDEIFTAREVAILAYLMSAGDLLLLPLLAVVVSLLSDFGLRTSDFGLRAER